MYRKAQGTPANKVAKSCQINRRQLSWFGARIVRKNSLGMVETNQQSFFFRRMKTELIDMDSQTTLLLVWIDFVH